MIVRELKIKLKFLGWNKLNNEKSILEISIVSKVDVSYNKKCD